MDKNVKMAQSIVGTSKGRPKDDFYPTPGYVTRALVDNIQLRNSRIWECACGDGAMSKVLENYGFSVYSSDLYDRGYGATGIDFLGTNALLCPTIITNPPFKLAEKFVYHAIHNLKCNELALFVKLAFLEGQKRSLLLESTPLKHVLVFRKRVTLTRNGEKQRNSGMIAFAWFYWQYGYAGNPMISWI